MPVQAIREWFATWGVIVNLLGVFITAGVVVERMNSNSRETKRSFEEFREDTREQIGSLGNRIEQLRAESGTGREGMAKVQAELASITVRIERLERFDETQNIINQTTMRDVARIGDRGSN